MKIEDDLFYCQNILINPNDIDDISKFTSIHHETGDGLVRYIQENAINDEKSGEMRTYIVRLKDTDELVGYFSLKAGLVSLHERNEDEKTFFDTFPGVELADFALDGNFINNYSLKGVGFVIFEHFVLPIIIEASKILGIYLVYIFALPIPKLMKNYEKYGFIRLGKESEKKLHQRLKPAYDEYCIFMYYPLIT